MEKDYLEIEEFMRVKTFMSSMDLYDLTLKQVKTYLKDKRLTEGEKAILRSSTLLKYCEYQEIIDTLLPLKIQHVLVESQRKLMLGIAYNKLGEPLNAIACLEESAATLRKYKLRRYEHIALVHLFYGYLNLKNRKGIKKTLELIEDIRTVSEKEKISLLRCKFNYAIFVQNTEDSLAYLKKLEKFESAMHPGQLIAHLVDKFTHYIQTEEFEECQLVLGKMKKHRRHNLSANYNYMKSLLNHITSNAPLYLYDKDFESYTLLYFQLKVVKCLSEKDEEGARKFWSELHGLNPEVFKTFMDYGGEKSLFSLCLAKYKNEVPQSPPSGFDLEGLKLTKMESKLVRFLIDRPPSVDKMALIDFLWEDCQYDENTNSKLSMLVGRIRKKTGLNIVSQKGRYSLQAISEKKVS